MPLTKRNPALIPRLKCFFRGHAWVRSKAYPGYHTCRRCRLRKRVPETWVEANNRVRETDVDRRPL